MSNRLKDDSAGVKIEAREWDLNENSTNYDRLVAAPSDETMQSQWILFVVILVLSVVLMLFVFMSILRDKRTRQNSFNTYILFLMGPDILFNLCCTLSCSLNLQLGRYFSADGCVFQSLYSIFAVTSSAWINAIAAYQLHRMLKCSHKAIRYHPPTRRQVARHCLAIYVFSIFMATWSSWGQESWWPIRNNVYRGVFCLPMPFDKESTLFFYLLYAPLVFVLPLLYICYVVVDMVYHNLLPDRNQRKTLMVFLRLLVVYFVMWLPALGLTFVGGNYLSSWWVVIGGAWAHLQGAGSAAICLFKPDIQMACQKSLSCCSYTPNEKETSRQEGTEETPSRSSREYQSREMDPPMEHDIQFHNQRSCEFFLGILEDDDNSDERPMKSWRSSASGQEMVDTRSAYEISMGLEAGGLHAIPSEELVDGNYQESSSV